MSSVADTNARFFHGVQTINSVVSTICGISIHGYILCKMLKRDSALSQYQHLIVLLSAVAIISIFSQLVLNQTISIDGDVSLFFPFLDFHVILQKTIFFWVAASEAIQEFLIIAFNIHRVLIFLRPHWIKKFYLVFTPPALAYAAGYGVLMARAPPKDILATVMELLLVPIIVAASIVCYVLIVKHFRNVSGYTEKVKQMQERLSTSIYLQGVIHCVLAVTIALLIPLNLLVAVITDNERVRFTFALLYNLFIFIIFRWYSAVTGALMLWSVRGFFQQQKIHVEGKQPFNRLAN